MELDINPLGLIIFLLIIAIVPLMTLIFSWRYYKKHQGTNKSKVALSASLITLILVAVGIIEFFFK